MSRFFNALPTPYMLLSPALVIEAASDAQLHATLSSRERLVGQYLFDAFPDNPLMPEAQTYTADAGSCPQLILLDLNMPVMNGREFLDAYMQFPAAQQQAIVLVVLTTSLHEQDRLLAHQLPIADFLTKPLTRAKVTELLARHFAQVSPASQPAGVLAAQAVQVPALRRLPTSPPRANEVWRQKRQGQGQQSCAASGQPLVVSPNAGLRAVVEALYFIRWGQSDMLVHAVNRAAAERVLRLQVGKRLNVQPL